MLSSITPNFSDLFKKMSEGEIMIAIGQDSGDFLQTSSLADFNTNLFGTKSRRIIKFIIDEVKSNKLKFSVVNKKENISVLIANLYRIIYLGLRDYCHAPMSPGYFKAIGKETNGKIGYNGWSETVKIFKQLGYIQTVKGYEGWFSRIEYTDKFHYDFIEKFKLDPQDILKTRPSITKKNSKGVEVEVKNSRRTYQVIRRVENYNKLLLNTDIVPGKMDATTGAKTPFANRTYTRRFVKRNLKLGGRFYGPYWQNLPKRYRKLIKINGKEVVELDYNAMHLHLLYSKINKSLYDYYSFAEEPYTALEYDRKIVKFAFTACINENCTRKNVNQVLGQRVSKALPDLFERGLPYGKIIDALADNHPQIGSMFYSEIGHEIAYMESRVTDYIVTVLTKHRIPTLSIHDSFIVGKAKVSFLRIIMQEAFTKLRYKSIPFIK